MKLSTFIFFLLLFPLFLASSPVAHENCPETLGLLRPQKIGQAPDFTLPDLQGKAVSLKDFRGKFVFINFWATWCPPCVEEMPSIEAMHRKLGPQGVVVLAVSRDVRQEPVRQFVKRFKLTFTILLDSKNELGRKYGVQGLPASFILDKEGNLLYLALGARDWNSECAQHLFSEAGKAS